MRDAAGVVRRGGGVVAVQRLELAGIDQRARAKAVKTGAIVRLRNGWFATPDADVDRIRAVRLGGRLTAASLLAKRGLWVMPDPRLHVAVRPNSGRLRSPDDRRSVWHADEHPDVCLHWRQFPWDPPADSVVDSLWSAVAQLITSASRECALVTLDSMLNTTTYSGQMLELDELSRILDVVPARYRSLIDWVDPRAQSGLETLARIRLRSRGVRVRTQVAIDNVGIVDVLLGERLVLELDGRRHHLGEAYERDRARDLELFRQGFLVIRVSYRRVLEDWDAVEKSILEMIRRGDHLRRSIHHREGLALT